MDILTGFDDVVTAAEHESGKMAHHRLGFEMKVAHHGIGLPASEHANFLVVYVGAEERSGAPRPQ